MANYFFVNASKKYIISLVNYIIYFLKIINNFNLKKLCVMNEHQMKIWFKASFVLYANKFNKY